MKKVLIKVSKTYSVKNKLQKQVLENLQELDGTLTDKKQAIGLIKLAFNDALNNYNGTAAAPKLQTFEANDNTTVYYVEDVVNLNIYSVIHDLL